MKLAVVVDGSSSALPAKCNWYVPWAPGKFATAFSFSDVRMDSLFLPVKGFEHNPRLRAL